MTHRLGAEALYLFGHPVRIRVRDGNMSTTSLGASRRSTRAKGIGIGILVALVACSSPPFSSVASAAQDGAFPAGVLAAENGGYLPKLWAKGAAVFLLPITLPFLASAYYLFRRDRRAVEVSRIIDALGCTNKYIEMYKRIHSGWYFVLAATWVWILSTAGLAVLFFGTELLSSQPDEFPLPGSSLVFGMAFLGSYVWGLGYIFRRYMMNDLLPGAFIRLSIRMLVASIVALIIFNGYEGFIGSDGGAAGAGADNVEAGAWPALAFFLGAFPRRGLDWITAKIPFLSSQGNPAVRDLPLEMIEGIDTYDQLRLEEIGIDNCYDLANYDFVPLILKTSYGAREVTDWILQAKLCVRCGDAVASLRQQGIRGMHDLACLGEEDLEPLANETAATLSSLKRAWKLARTDPEIERLQSISVRVARFTQTEDAAQERAVLEDRVRKAG